MKIAAILGKSTNKKGIETMKMKEKFEKAMKKHGIIVAAGMAGDWQRSRQHAENWNQGSAGRRVAWATWSISYNAWIEPTKSYASWAEAMREIPYICGERV